jgi:hypothetical protein
MGQSLSDFIGVCKRNDNGSFWLITLAIQSAGGMISIMFTSIERHED